MLDHVNPRTGRVHPSFIQIGAPSGRFACMDPSVQQIPNAPEYRDCIRAPEGRKLVVADYSQIELRILADWSQDAALLKAFQSGEDLHRVTAAQMFNVPLDHVTKSQRSAAKSLNFGLLYGMGAQGLAFRIDVSPLEAEQLIRKYFAAYRGVERWLREAGERAVRERETRTRAGRLVRFDFDDADRGQVAGIVRLGKNVPIQGTSADITKLAMIRLDEELSALDACLVNTVHDELVVECDASVAAEAKTRVERAMVGAGREYIKSIPVVVEALVADAWMK
jgi:DNA polymerase-1